ncbi:MFS transporter, partial [Variovorax sp.]|uniref:MFS transporter n=1 Tax=Variovorax sp. TaxID=1871043 RepID=UPI0037DA23A9
ADPATCSFQGNPVAREIDFRSSCDIAKRYLVQNSVSYENVAGAPGSKAVVKIGDKTVEAPIGNVVNLKFDETSAKEIAAFKKGVAEDLKIAGYPAKADPAKMNKLLTVLLLFWLVLLVTMVYGPIAAMLVELFPTRIRYTSMSLPYHIGNGWFGGLLPTTAFAIVASTGNMYNGLWYPIIIAAITLVIGTLFIRETKDVDIYAHD